MSTVDDDVEILLSYQAAAFLLGTVRHMNQKKILPPDNEMALQTSAWLEHIEAATEAGLRAVHRDTEAGR